MDAQIEENINYYDFLIFIQEISKKVNSIQQESVKLVYENFNSSIVKRKINLKIKNLDELLSN
jgi:hypothetical protein